MLEKAQANYALRAVHLAKGEHKTAEYLAVNPKGKVPALLTVTGVITETPAILLFLHAHYPDAGILPANVSNVEAVSDLAWFASFVHPLITRYCKPDLLGVTTDVDAVKDVSSRREAVESQPLLVWRRLECYRRLSVLDGKPAETCRL